MKMAITNLQWRDILLIWIIVGQGPTALAVGAGEGLWTSAAVPKKSENMKMTILKHLCTSE